MSEPLILSSASLAGIATYPPGATYGPRRMLDFEFVWIIEGDAEYHWDEQRFAAPEGAILLCRPGATDFFRWDTQRRTRHGYFHFEVNAHPSAWGHFRSWPFVQTPVEGDVLRPLFRHLLTWRDKGDRMLQDLTMRHILTAFVTGQSASADVPRDVLHPAVERAMQHVYRVLDADPAAAIDLEELAAAASVTPEHLCRIFKSATGHSPVQTVRLARLDRAAVLLARSNYSVKQIARMCGFASEFHFSRRFRAAYGKPPAAFRRHIQNGEIPPTPLLLRHHIAID